MIRRLLTFVLLTALLVVAGVWLADHPGQVVIHWQGWRVDTTLAALLVILVLVMTVLVLLWRVVHGIVTAPRAFVARWRAKRLQDGYRALSDGLAAVASGQNRQARKLARRADRLLKDQSITGLLSMQAAELSGDLDEVENRLKSMAERPQTAFLALKGLTDLCLKRGQIAPALDYARRAWALGGQGTDLAATLFDLQTAHDQWGEAHATLAEAARRKAMPKDQLTRLQSMVWTRQAQQADQQGDADDALDLAQRACKVNKTATEATILTARLLHRRNKHRQAQSILADGWKHRPDPALIQAWYDLAPAETPLQRVDRLGKLIRTNPDAPLGHLTLGIAALDAKLWGQARTHLLRAAQSQPLAETYSALARLERDENHDEAAAQAWLAKAATIHP